MNVMKKNIMSLIIFVICFMLISCYVFAYDNGEKVKISLMKNGPILSPNGYEIAFDFIWETTDRGGSEIAVLSLKDYETQIITKNLNNSFNESPSWSKDSKNILLRSTKEDGIRLLSIYRDTLRRKELLFIQDNDEREEYLEISYLYPIWNPLKDKIVFIKRIASRDSILDLLLGYVYDLRTKKEKEIARNLSNSVTFKKTWGVSFDGNYVFYTKKDNENNDIWIREINKNKNRVGEQHLTEGYNVSYLQPSPTKNEILFIVEENSKSSWTLHRMNFKTKKSSILYKGKYNNLGFPLWSHDGNQILIVNNGNIIIIDATKSKISSELKIDMENIIFPLLVKNKKIVFYKQYSSIWSIDFEGKNLKKIFPSNLKMTLKELKGIRHP